MTEKAWLDFLREGEAWTKSWREPLKPLQNASGCPVSQDLDQDKGLARVAEKNGLEGNLE